MESVKKTKIGIIICDRYKSCAGGKCFKAAENKEGAFSIYQNGEIEIAGYTTCGGCPGGNVEYAPEEMKKNGIEVIHLATGLVVGYPPCPYTDYFKEYIETKFGIKTVIGTHPIPEKYLLVHEQLNTWRKSDISRDMINILADKEIRISYN